MTGTNDDRPSGDLVRNVVAERTDPATSPATPPAPSPTAPPATPPAATTHQYQSPPRPRPAPLTPREIIRMRIAHRLLRRGQRARLQQTERNLLRTEQDIRDIDPPAALRLGLIRAAIGEALREVAS